MAYLLNLQGTFFINSKIASLCFEEIVTLGPLWFTTLIMICYLLVPLFQKYRNKYNNKLNKNSIYIITIIVLLGLDFIFEWKLGTSFAGIIAFFAGYLLSNINIEKYPYSLFRTIVYIIIVPLLMSIRILIKIMNIQFELYAALVSIGHTILGMSIFLLIIAVSKKIPTIFEKIASSRIVILGDKISIYIYMVHAIFCFGATSVFEKNNIFVATIMFFVLTITCALIIWKLTDGVNWLIYRILKK